MMVSKMAALKFLFPACFCAIIIPVLGLPSIRIQVNNENLQSPPYLLETIKQIELSASRNGSDPTLIFVTPKEHLHEKPAVKTEKVSSQSASGSRVGGPELASKNETAISGDGLMVGSGPEVGYSVVKEETIEEILDLDSDSILKLSPENLMSAISPSDYSRITDTVSLLSSESNQEHHQTSEKVLSNPSELLATSESQLQPQIAQQNQRKPTTLPVSNAHLKRPAMAPLNEESAREETSEQSGDPKKSGAHTLVSPSIARDSEEGAREADEAARKKRKQAQQVVAMPDLLEPSQIMNGVSNASQVPAIVNREYGQHQTRTRVTLGGGYVRDRLPPLVNPSSSAYKEERPEKPMTPLERPHLVEASEMSSHQVEVPQKLVMIANQMSNPKQQQQSVLVAESSDAAANSSRLPAPARLDSRCPKMGVMTFEHPSACDKYFYCEDGRLSEQSCPNGLMYGTRDMVKDYCVHRWKAVCGEKSVPNPISSPGCRWQYGIFSVQGSPKCSPDFYECTEGQFEVRKCPVDGQVYDDRTKSCKFAEQAGCAKEALTDFQCPPDDQGNTYWPFPRYFLNERALIHCVNDKPEIVRCTDEERVDPEHLHCVPLAKVQKESSASGERRAREKKKVTPPDS